MIFRQLCDLTSSTYTYLLGDPASGEAILIDPVFDHATRDAALLNELGLRLTATLETHVHADHVTSAWLLRNRLGSRIALSATSGAQGADRYLAHGDRVEFGRHQLQARATPGHTDGCLTYVLDDQGAAFTGDCLLIRGSGRTDFQRGDAHAMYRSVHDQIFSLPANCLIYPAHDYRGLTVSSVAEERRFNPRLGAGIIDEDFVGYMRNLGLPHPKQIDVAVPANLQCGRPEAGADDVAAPQWAPVTFTFAGIHEIQPDMLEENIADAQVVDVREADEFEGPLGHIAQAQLFPLGELAKRSEALARELPLVTVCRSGARSAQAAVILQRLGFTQVANLAGGMLRWRAHGHPVVGGKE